MTAVIALAASGATLVITALLAWLVVGRRLGSRIDALEDELRRARELADLDALTSLYNRRYFHDSLAREVARAARYDRTLALLVLDLDDFKAINERIGHLGGDAVLAEAAAALRDAVRTADIPCRVGGDELAVILPESAADDAERIYTRLHQRLSTRSVAGAGPISLSAGVAELGAADDALAFFQRADAALYRAKAGGKGQISASAAPS